MAKHKSQSEKQEIACRACEAGVGDPWRTDEPASDRSARHKAWKRWSARNSAHILFRESLLVRASEAANRVNESVPDFIEASVHPSCGRSAPDSAASGSGRALAGGQAASGSQCCSWLGGVGGGGRRRAAAGGGGRRRTWFRSGLTRERQAMTTQQPSSEAQALLHRFLCSPEGDRGSTARTGLNRRIPVACAACRCLDCAALEQTPRQHAPRSAAASGSV
jgi:hypothetical protein